MTDTNDVMTEARAKKIKHAYESSTDPLYDEPRYLEAIGYLQGLADGRGELDLAQSQAQVFKEMCEIKNEKIGALENALEVSQARLETTQACLLAADRMWDLIRPTDGTLLWEAKIAYRAARELTRDSQGG